MNRRLGFTLIELLTVIAIIAILAAIIFPVYTRAKDSAYRGSDISALNDLRSALQLYRIDQGGYPPALLGYVSRYQSGPNAGNVIPADQITGFLYPKRVVSLGTFTPAYNRAGRNVVTEAVWPNRYIANVGADPILDLNGDGNRTPADDTIGARQAYGPDTFVLLDPSRPQAANNPRAEFYKVSGYDVAEVPDQNQGRRTELRYTLFWTNYAIGQGNSAYGSGSPFDDPRQLGYDDPPESTVVTWDSFFRDWTNFQPQGGRRDIVLFLGGGAKTYDSKLLHQRSWRVMP
jgi:prepilin-type N-terminal cleavage/methylation domain-containing protein